MKQPQTVLWHRPHPAPYPSPARRRALPGLLALPLLGAFALPSLAQTAAAPGISTDPTGPKSQIPPAIAGNATAPVAAPNPGGAGTPGGPGLPANPTGPLSPNPTDNTAPATTGAPLTDIETLRAQLAAQQAVTAQLLARLDALEKRGATVPGTPGTPAANATPIAAAPIAITSKFPIAISGTYFQRFDTFSGQKGGGPQLFNTFRTRRGQIGLNTTISPRVSSFLLVNFGKLSPNVPLVNAPLQTLSLSYKLSAVKPKSPNASSLFFDIGAFKIPLGYEGDIPDGNTQFIERSLLFRVRDRFGGGSSEVSDTGAQLRFKFGANKFDARLGVFNGLGERSNQTALADPKAYVGRLAYRFRPDGQGLQLGVSAAFAGDQNIPVVVPMRTGITGRGKRELYNAFAIYKVGKFAGSAEILGGRSGLAGVSNNAIVPGERVRSVLGYYAGGGYALSKKFELIGRYDSFDFARDFVPAAGQSGDTTVREYTVGLNYYLNGLNAKIATNYVRVEGGSGLLSAAFPGQTNTTSFRNTRNEIRTQFQVAF